MAKQITQSKYDSMDVCITDILWDLLHIVHNENMYLQRAYDCKNVQSLLIL
jgi:hypothetical protein